MVLITTSGRYFNVLCVCSACVCKYVHLYALVHTCLVVTVDEYECTLSERGIKMRWFSVILVDFAQLETNEIKGSISPHPPVLGLQLHDTILNFCCGFCKSYSGFLLGRLDFIHWGFHPFLIVSLCMVLWPLSLSFKGPIFMLVWNQIHKTISSLL